MGSRRKKMHLSVFCMHFYVYITTKTFMNKCFLRKAENFCVEVFIRIIVVVFIVLVRFSVRCGCVGIDVRAILRNSVRGILYLRESMSCYTE